MDKQIGSSQSQIRKDSSALVLDHLRLHAPLSRGSLLKHTGLIRGSVSRIVDQLLAEKMLQEIWAQPERGGRSGTLIELNPSFGAALGVEIGVGYISVILTDFIAQVLWRRNLSLPNNAGLSTYLDTSEKLISAAMQESILSGFELLGIGVGVWGQVDIQEGEIRFAPNLNWHDVPLKQLWEKRFGVTVFIENEANAAAVGEYYLGSAVHAKNEDDFIYLSTGIGLGGGIIRNGEVFRGGNGYAGEVGHMVIDLEGGICMCGKRGCWETFVGSRVAVQNYKARTGSQVSFDELVHLLRTNHPVSLEIFTDMAIALGIGISNLVNIFNPRCIVVGGALDQISGIVLPIAKETFSKNSLLQSSDNVRITSPALGSDSCALGCVILTLDEVIRLRTRL